MISRVQWLSVRRLLHSQGAIDSTSPDLQHWYLGTHIKFSDIGTSLSSTGNFVFYFSAIGIIAMTSLQNTDL